MRLGGFGRIADYDNIQQTGFDYAELDVPEIEASTEGEFRIFCDKVHEIGFPMPTGARALPVAEPWLFTDFFNALEYKAYLERARHRVKLLRIDRIIIGSNRARLLIDETSIKEEDRFIDFMRMFAEIAGNYDIEIILKPLGLMYSNYIDSLPEAVRIIREADVPNLFTMADLRHLVWAEEPLTDIVSYSDYIRHIHVDYPISYPARPFPNASDDLDYTEFLDVLKESGHQGTLTIEADIPGDWERAYRDMAAILHVFLWLIVLH